MPRSMTFISSIGGLPLYSYVASTQNVVGGRVAHTNSRVPHSIAHFAIEWGRQSIRNLRFSPRLVRHRFRSTSEYPAHDHSASISSFITDLTR